MIGHMRERVDELFPFEIVERTRPSVPPEWYYPYDNDLGDVPPMASFGEGYRYHVTGLCHDKSGFPTLRLDEIDRWQERLFHKIEGNVDDIAQIEEEGMEEVDTVVVSYGASARSARHAVNLARERGRSVGMVKLLTLWPFPEIQFRELAYRVKRVIVVEMNKGQMKSEVERVMCGRTEVEGVNRCDGDMVNPYTILKVIEER